MVITRLSILGAILLVLVTIAGCHATSVGMQFEFQNIPQLELGKTSLTEAVRLLGPPSNRKTSTISDEDVSILGYEYLVAPFSGPSSSVRTLSLEFKNSILNAYFHISTFPEDSTIYDRSLNTSLDMKGFSKSEVLAKMGSPLGKALCPCTMMPFQKSCNKAMEVWTWSEMRKPQDKGIVTFVSTMIVGFDKNGLVLFTTIPQH
jgi:hypothetical protein